MRSLVHALYANPERLTRYRDQLKRNRLTCDEACPPPVTAPTAPATLSLARFGGYRCPAFDAKKGVEVLERGLKMVWRRHEDGKAPAHVAVPAPKRSR